MRKHLAKFVLTLLAMSMVLIAVDSPFTGTWKLNVAKSKFSPGPPNKSQTVTIQADGHVSVEEVTGTGQTESWSYMPIDGSPATIDGLPNSTVVEKRTDDRTVEHEWKMDGMTTTGHGVLSKNGKVLTYTMQGTTAKGQAIHNVLIFEKQ